jgi:alpha-galactosidase
MYPETVRMRSIEGSADTSKALPPPAYRINDTTQVVSLHGGKWSGRSTEREMPYAVIVDEAETSGFYIMLEWSGCWVLGLTRQNENLSCWAHPAGAKFRLKPGEEISIPKATLGFFSGGLDDGCNVMRRHFAMHIRRPGALPVFYNHYYGFYSKFDERILRQEADFYAQAGCEYFVVDGGWFIGGFRNGIGNWDEPDPKKFPSGMERFADYVRSLGMKFGLWFEPEFAMTDSAWFCSHPEYYFDPKERCDAITCVPYKDRLFKFNDQEAREFMMKFLVSAVKRYGIEWIRWDCNNALADFWDANESPEDFGRLQFDYITGLYRFLDEFRTACPQVHLENCASGGYRMDPGLLRRADSAWMNDNVEYHSVRRYQANLNSFVPGFANSVFFPNAFFSELPLEKIYSKFAGPLGFSEKSEHFSATAAAKLKEIVAKYKQVRHLLLKDYYTHFSPKSLREPDGWQFHDPETGEGLFAVFRCEAPESTVKTVPKGLAAGKYEAVEIASGKTLWFEAGSTIEIELERKSDCGLFHYHRFEK